MKTCAFVLLLPCLLLSSCFDGTPYAQQRPPVRRDRSPYYPYGQGQPYETPRPQPYDGYQPETGSYRPVTPPPQSGMPPVADNTPRIPSSYDPDPDPAPAPSPRPTYLTAKTTDTPGHVISPYPPFNVVDVSHLKSGQLATEPGSTQKFKVP